MSADTLPPKPSALAVDFDGIPDNLRVGIRFVLWRYQRVGGKWTKVPFQARSSRLKAATDNPQTWASFDEARAAYEKGGFDGIGIVLVADDDLCGVDLDHCVDPTTEEISAGAGAIIDTLDSYTTLSPSGTGVRIFARGRLPSGGCKKGDFEMYESGRYLTLTGHTVGAERPIAARQTQLKDVHRRIFGEARKSDYSANAKVGAAYSDMRLDDAALLEKMFGNEKTGAATKRLWDGDTSAHSGDASAADLALASRLLFWCNYDAARADDLFRLSGLMRPKWDEKHSGDGRTYGQMTLDKALEGKAPGDGYRPGPSATFKQSQDDEGRQARKKVMLAPDFYVQAQDIITALHALNDPPVIFQRGRELSRIVTVEGKPAIEPFDPDSIRNFIQSRLECVKLAKVGEGEYKEMPANPGRTVASYILTSSHWPFPELRGIVYAPHFSASGELVTDPGYSQASKLYLDLGGFTPRPVPTYPTAAEVNAARDLVLNELLPDFPFVDDASKAHAVVLGLLPYVRTMIDGPTPLHGIDASTPGTGKSLFVEVVTYAATGLLPRIMSEGQNDDEWRKRITSTLLDSPTAVMIDNVNRRLDSGSLSAAVTSRVWTDRKLGQSQNVNIPNLACWTVTGNNLTTSKEIARRLLWIRLDAKMERPWERTEFRHPKIMEWVNMNRHAVVHAFLTLAQNWIAKGKPKPEKSLGSFEAWSAVVGGILEAAGIEGFLGNLDALYDRADAESQEWRSFVELWWAAHTNKPVGTAELHALAVQNDVLLNILGDKGEMSQKVRLGRALTSREDRVIGSYVIQKGAIDAHSKTQKYYLAAAPIGDHAGG